jgi:ribosomal protein S18 acetylase RimI-like enzyme
MAIAPANFRRVPGPTTRLDLSHLDALRQLYQLGGGDAFAPYQLRGGIYYGIEADGQLVSAAGTHLISPTYGVAAVGNIFTHPGHRRLGYATACTSQVVEELLALRRAQGRAQDLKVVLNVNQENTEAIGVYERLGFRRHCPYIEVVGNRKSHTTNSKGESNEKHYPGKP